ncbi:MAG TPA: Calx-beta domain-containing protein, partial [Candidatus Thermoplasmatota archaeon]|nr:Calx-beta domain-containing protein [Candidatus Thermoplasmatota archaeon]
SVRFEVSSPDATAGADYEGPAGGILRFAPGELEQAVTVHILDDDWHEPTERLTFRLHDPQLADPAHGDGLQDADAAVAADILDSDGPPTVTLSAEPGHAYEGGAPATVWVRLSHRSTTAASVTLRVAGGDASPDDYTTSSLTLTIPAGGQAGAVLVHARDDDVHDPGERVAFEVQSAQAVRFRAGEQAEVLLLDDDEPPYVRATAEDVREGDEGHAWMRFLVELVGASVPTRLRLQAVPGTADATDAALPPAVEVVLGPGNTRHALLVPVLGDRLEEEDETILLHVHAPDGDAIIDARADAVGRILDDDTARLLIDGFHAAEGDLPETLAPLVVRLSLPSSAPVPVRVWTVYGTAGASDLHPLDEEFVFAPGQTQHVVHVAVRGDLVEEPTEAFEVRASAPGRATASRTATIQDDDGPPVLHVLDAAAVVEGAAASFPLRLLPASPQATLVRYEVLAGTAGAGDVATGSGTLTIPAGATSARILVATKDDRVHEGEETFTLRIDLVEGAALGRGTASGAILDDDASHVVATAQPVREGGPGDVTPLDFEVALTLPRDRDVTLSVRARDGTADASDYVPRAAVLTIPAGSVGPLVFPVDVLGDDVAEGHETVLLEVEGAPLARAEPVGHILDDDGPPRALLLAAATREGDTGTSPMRVDVHVAPASGQPLELVLRPAEGTAGAEDADLTPWTLQLPALASKATAQLPVRGDLLAEGDEWVALGLEGLPAPPALGLILDDDEATAYLETVTVPEGDERGVRLLRFRLTAPLAHPVDAVLRVEAGTAHAGADVTVADHAFTVPAGATTFEVGVEVVGDRLDEPDETFLVRMLGGGPLRWAAPQAEVVIADDDEAPLLHVVDTSVYEGDAGHHTALVGVRLDAPSGRTVRVEAATSDVRATAYADYLPASATLVFLPGSTQASLAVVVLGDRTDEAHEEVRVTLAQPRGAG